MFQCTEGHLFCKECCIRNAETKLGEQVFVSVDDSDGTFSSLQKITCMDMSSCSAPFPETELARALPAKSLELYFRLKVASELVLAGIEGLETCPACDYAVVIDNPDEKLFVCMAKGCMQISCRRCRKKVSLIATGTIMADMQEHLPKSCEGALWRY
jgi:TRIAD3 protein (E3 ubiquitin-protein ligase RNF216)